MYIIYCDQSRLFARRRFLQLPTPAYGHESRSSSERNNDYGSLIGRHRRLLSEEERGRSGLSDDRLRAPRDDQGRRRVFTRILQDRDGSPVLAVSRSHGEVPQGELRVVRSGSQGPVRGDDRSETPRPIGGGRGMDSFAEERREG